MSQNNRCPKIILEGTRLTHKTEVAFELNAHPEFVGPRKYRYHSPLISAEWGAFTNTPWGRGLINFLPEEEDLAMETYRTWIRLFELQRYYSWVVDRFHLSTQVFQKTRNNRTYDFRWLEERLLPLGFVLVFLHRSPASFREAKRKRLLVSGNPSQYDDLTVFEKEQEVMEGFLERSLLPVFRYDVSDDSIPSAVEAIVTYFRDSGALFLPD